MAFVIYGTTSKTISVACSSKRENTDQDNHTISLGIDDGVGVGGTYTVMR